ncbi:MAG: hypothetical protein E4H13_03870 [Calditrichales bacterium]|nr:MAG: hypothetical protein E4H13_03870 [Calditrichales bacterium]
MKRNVFIRVGIFLIALFVFMNCAEEPTKSLYDPNYKPSKADPVVTAVAPEGGTFAAIGEVTITGLNFSSDPGVVHVYFGGVKGTLLSSSDTEIHVIAPNIAGDSLDIKVRIDGALMFGEFTPYKLEVAVRPYGGINYISDALGIACDGDENLYVSVYGPKIVKIAPDEVASDYVTADQGVDGAFEVLKMGPGGELYGARLRFLYKTPAGGGSIARASGRLGGRPFDLDFDENGNLYYASTGGVYMVRSDFTDTLMVAYPSVNLSSIRVYDGYVYTAGLYTGTGTPDYRVGIWRNQITNSNGILGATENVFNLEEYYDNTPGVPGIRTFTFAEDGDMYIGCDSTAISEAIIVARPTANGEYHTADAEPLFKVLLIPPATKLCWGAGQYMYMNRRSNNTEEKNLLRLTIGKNSAPYYGR